MEEFPTADRISPRMLFGREDTQFTPWLEDNIDHLNEELDMSLTTERREKSTPSGLSIDLTVTEENSGREGIIECQIEKSDHKHLGQVLTYITAFDSQFAIWIVEEPRYEHRKTIEWLNESTEKYFYLVKIEGVEINDERAPLFTPIVVPSPAAKEIGEKKRESDEKDLKQEKFWSQLLEKSEGRFELFGNISPKQQGWISKSSGEPRVYYRYRIRDHWADVGLYIDKNSKERNEEIVEILSQQSDTIEQKFGEELGWLKLEDSNASRIVYRVCENRGLQDGDDWDEIQEEMISHMERFYEAINEPLSDV